MIKKENFFWQVVLPFGLEKEVNSHLRAHLSKKAVNKDNLLNSYPASNEDKGQLMGGFEEKEKPSTKSAIAERILLQRSLQMRNKQQDWQVSIIQICAIFLV